MEFAGVYLMKLDPAVLEFWISRLDQTRAYSENEKWAQHNRNIGVLDTADYFVIRTKALEERRRI